MPGLLLLFACRRLSVLLLHRGQKVGVYCADFSPCALVFLLSFSLDYNKLGDETGKAMAQALTTNTTLTNLEYGGRCRGCSFACRRLSACCFTGGQGSGLLC